MSLPPVLLSCPSLKGNEEKYVVECLRSEWISTSGSYVARFETALAEYVGCSGAVACSSGTAALHICLLLAGVQPGDEVIVPTLTFIAPVNAVRYVGAEPVFLDCDEFLNLSVEKLGWFLRNQTSHTNGILKNKKTGKRIRAIIPVHVFGGMCQMDELMALADEYGLTVIEDATEALGSTMTGRHAGTIGQFGCYSFNGNKIITSGGGGMIVARDPAHLAKAKYLTTQAKDDELHYVHNEVGYNYRLTAIQAALGLAQLEQLDEFIRIKEARFKQYQDAVKSNPGLSMLPFPSYCKSNHWFYSLLIDPSYGVSRDELMAKFTAAKIQARPIWKLNHTQKPYVSCEAYDIDRAPFYFERVLNVPCSVGLTDEEFERVIDVLRG